jgi:putative endonuclease
MARRFLEDRGLTILETNYRFGRGEIDIIARDGEDLVFCEVKARWNDRYGPPEYAVTPKKQQQLRKVAEGYLLERGIRDQACRFDVVAIQVMGGKSEIHYLRNAF